jgi:RNA polymerase sigma-70 factor (ECF subfamily)
MMNQSPSRTNCDLSTSSSLIRGVQKHEPEAWRRLADVFGPLIYFWSRRWGLSPEDSADIVQETLLAVARNVARFETGPERSFRAWLWTITRSKICDFNRRRDRQPQAGGGSSVQKRLQQLPERLSADDVVEQGAWKATLLRALESARGDFEERTWQAFWLVAVQGRTPAEAAAELGISAAAVRQAKCRVLQRLREAMGLAPGPSPRA